MCKRVAIQLFGHLRSFRKTHESFFKYIVEPQLKNGYEVDIFIHTWNETDHSTITWHNQNGEKRGLSVDQKILVENQIKVDNFIITEKIASAPRAFSGVANVAYTQFMSSKIRRAHAEENNIKYDYVIVTRPDIMFHKPFDIDNFLYIYNEYNWDIPQNGLFFAHNFFARGNVEDRHMIGGSDIIFFGNEDVINKATNLYTEIHEKTIKPSDIEKDFYCFEVFWYNYWLKQNLEPIRIKYIQFSYFNIVRNEEEYNRALLNNELEYKKVYNIKTNAINNFDENVFFQSQKERKSKFDKIKREILKILPYCIVHKKINILNEKIKGCK